MSDTGGLTSSSTLTVTIQGANDTPVANTDTATAVEAGGLANATPGANASGNVLTNDTDVDVVGETKTVTTTGVTAGTYGTLTLNANGSYTYVIDNSNPLVNSRSSDDPPLSEVFSYTMRDAAGLTSISTLTVAITGRNDFPVARDDFGRINDDRPLTINVKSNDSDVDDTLFFVTKIDGQPIVPGGSVILSIGIVTLNTDGTLTFVPSNNADGPSVFEYALSDPHGGTTTANVTINVSQVPPPTPPSAPPPGVPAPRSGDNGARIDDQAREPSVFFDGAVFDRIPRLPIPFHPIVFVNREVTVAQDLRFESDPLTFGSEPSRVLVGEIRSTTIGSGLGFDPALFVQHSVRASQQQGTWLDAVIDGRHGITTLSSESEIPTPGLFNNESGTPPPEQQTDEGTTVSGFDMPAQVSEIVLASSPEESPAPARTPQSSLAAPSFTQQLRNAQARHRAIVQRHSGA